MKKKTVSFDIYVPGKGVSKKVFNLLIGENKEWTPQQKESYFHWTNAVFFLSKGCAVTASLGKGILAIKYVRHYQGEVPNYINKPRGLGTILFMINCHQSTSDNNKQADILFTVNQFLKLQESWGTVDEKVKRDINVSSTFKKYLEELDSLLIVPLAVAGEPLDEDTKEIFNTEYDFNVEEDFHVEEEEHSTSSYNDEEE